MNFLMKKGSRLFSTIASKNIISSGNPTTSETYWMLTYQYVPEMLTKRTPVRQEHLDLIKSYYENKQLDATRLVLVGAFPTPTAVTGGGLIFQTADPQTIERFVQSDPYMKNGLISSYLIQEYAVIPPPKP